jgi:hypothetical protein
MAIEIYSSGINIAVNKGLACLDLLIALWNIFDGGVHRVHFHFS